MSDEESVPDRSLSSLTKDTRLCISLAGRPSNVGTRFHNYLYAELGLDFVYKAFTTTDLPAAVAGVRALGIRGAGVSMPFKEDVIALVDVMHASASAIDSVNTVVNEDGELHAHNTDYQAVADLLAADGFPFGPGSASGPGSTGVGSAAVAGSGGMARAVVAALRDGGVTEGTVVARNEAAGRALAEEYGFAWSPTPVAADVLANATPVGMAGGPDEDASPFAPELLASAAGVLDVVALPSRTPLVRAAEAAGLPVISGAEVIALQAAAQFELYTGLRPTPAQVRAASAYSRA